MRYLSWTLKIIVFVILLGFALQNTAVVSLNTFLGYNWQAPLIFIMLVCFVIGAICGVLASFTQIIKLRRELIRLRKEINARTPASPPTVELILEPPRDAL